MLTKQTILPARNPANSASPRSRRWAEFFLCVVVLPLFGLTVLYIPLKTAGLGASADFIQFYAAGKIVESGNAAKLYDANLQSDLQWQTAERDPPTLFNHPPFEAILYSPLARLAYPQAFLVWTFVNLAALGLVFFFLRPYGPPFATSDRLLLLAAAFHPALACVVQGQDSLLVVLAYLAAFLFLKAGRETTAGIFLGAGLIKPQLILPFALLMLLRGRMRLIAGLAISAAALIIFSVLLVGPSVAAHYPFLLLHMNDPGQTFAFHIFPETMPNLRGLLTLILGGAISPRMLTVLVAVLSAGILIWVNRVCARPLPFDLAFSLMIVATLLVSFHALIHDLTLLILPVFLFLNHVRNGLSSSISSRTVRRILHFGPPVFLLSVFFLTQALGSRNFSFAALPLMALAFAIASDAFNPCHPDE